MIDLGLRFFDGKGKLNLHKIFNIIWFFSSFVGEEPNFLIYLFIFLPFQLQRNDTPSPR